MRQQRLSRINNKFMVKQKQEKIWGVSCKRIFPTWACPSTAAGKDKFAKFQALNRSSSLPPTNRISALVLTVVCLVSTQRSPLMEIILPPGNLYSISLFLRDFSLYVSWIFCVAATWPIHWGHGKDFFFFHKEFASQHTWWFFFVVVFLYLAFFNVWCVPIRAIMGVQIWKQCLTLLYHQLSAVDAKRPKSLKFRLEFRWCILAGVQHY